MARTYTAITLIPDGYIFPGDAEPTLTTYEERVSAINAAADLPRQVREWSDGMANLSMVIRQAPIILDESVFHAFEGSYFPDPARVSALDEDRERYDFTVVSTGKIGSGHPYVGFAWTERWFVAANQPQTQGIHAHELMHVLERYLKREHGYSNWPDCGQGEDADTAVHCNAKYGYPRSIGTDWIRLLYNASLPDGTGVNASGWAILTPTEDGKRSPVDPDEVVASEWDGYRTIYVPGR